MGEFWITSVSMVWCSHFHKSEEAWDVRSPSVLPLFRGTPFSQWIFVVVLIEVQESFTRMALAVVAKLIVRTAVR